MEQAPFATGVFVPKPRAGSLIVEKDPVTDDATRVLTPIETARNGAPTRDRRPLRAISRILWAALALAVSSLASAGPFIISDPLALGVTHCGVYLDDDPEVRVPVAVVAEGKICKYDLAGVAPGAHSVAMTAITLSDPVWGFQESAKSAPFAFTVNAPGAIAVEYFHAGFGHYFTTASVDEVAKLDRGAFAGWVRTGQVFNVLPTGTPGQVNVCRFFSVSFNPKSSHFYTPSPYECAAVKQNPDWQFEGEVFSVLPPTGGDQCPIGWRPLYRLYNNGRGGSPNHRYTTSIDTRSDMLGQGWISEGFGPVGVIGCIPS